MPSVRLREPLERAADPGPLGSRGPFSFCAAVEVRRRLRREPGIRGETATRATEDGNGSAANSDRAGRAALYEGESRRWSQEGRAQQGDPGDQGICPELPHVRGVPRESEAAGPGRRGAAPRGAAPSLWVWQAEGQRGDPRAEPHWFRSDEVYDGGRRQGDRGPRPTAS